jgi:branched-chain amino acid transport system permease protein
MSIGAELWQFVLSGLVVGGIFALIAVGFALTYQVSGLINFAQGEFAMIGALTASSLYAGGSGWPVPAAAAAGVVAAALVGAVAYLLAFRPSRGYNIVTLIFISLGLDIALRGAALYIWGTNPYQLAPFLSGNAVMIAGGSIPPQAVWVFASDIVLVAVLYTFFARTYLGSAVRAATINPSIASTFGIPLKAFAFWSFVAAAVVGGIGGVMIAPISTATYDMGLTLGLNGFVAAVVGGLDSLPGAFCGGFLLGIAEKLCGGLLSAGWEQGIAFVLLIFVLVMRPQGLFAPRVRRA